MTVKHVIPRVLALQYGEGNVLGMVMVVVRDVPRPIIAVVGIGTDADHPFRPWPWFSKTLTPRGHTYYCLSLLGLFAGLSTGGVS